MASFSSDAKTEICGAIRRDRGRRAFLTGILLACRRFSEEEIAVQTECSALAGLFPQLLQTAVRGLLCDTVYRKKQQAVWTFLLDADGARQLLNALNLKPGMRAEAVQNCAEQDLPMLAGGCFAAGGSVTDPERRYHMELVLPEADAAEALRQRLAQTQAAIMLKTVQRKGDTVLYLKQNEQICDALAYFGASNASLNLAEQQVYKTMLGQANRRRNCDMANIDKTVAACAQQEADIRLIQARIGLDALPEPLQEIARLRLAEPDMNLRDLGALCAAPISRSGVYHRLQRIAALAEKLRNADSAKGQER